MILEYQDFLEDLFYLLVSVFQHHVSVMKLLYLSAPHAQGIYYSERGEKQVFCINAPKISNGTVKFQVFTSRKRTSSMQYKKLTHPVTTGSQSLHQDMQRLFGLTSTICTSLITRSINPPSQQHKQNSHIFINSSLQPNFLISSNSTNL